MLLVGGKRFTPLSRYFAEKNVSLSREKHIARSAGLLIDFIAARGSHFADISNRHNLYNAFAHALAHGTIKDAQDPSALWWLPRSSANVESLLESVCDFSDWLVRRQGTEPLNPYRVASQAERIVFWRTWNQAKYASLLAHIRDSDTAIQASQVARTFRPPANPSSTEGRPPFFPHERFDDLLLSGFARHRAHGPLWKRLNLRDMMVAILLHAGGLRVSEPFHLWVNDVFTDPFDPNMAVVRVYDPSDGLVSHRDLKTGNWVSARRAEYLRLVYDRRPLNYETPHNGWKGNLLRPQGKYMPIFWYPSYYGILFLKLFKLYINFLRPTGLNHPWLFVTERGDPFTAKAYRKQHAIAVRRIGLQVAKADGTTPHGHRHSYGQLLQDAKEAGIVDTKIFQVVMHHRSPLSQQHYNDRDFSQVNDLLGKAETRLPMSGRIRTMLDA